MTVVKCSEILTLGGISAHLCKRLSITVLSSFFCFVSSIPVVILFDHLLKKPGQLQKSLNLAFFSSRSLGNCLIIVISKNSPPCSH